MVELVSYRHSRHFFRPSLWHADPALGLLVVPANVAEAADGNDPRRRVRGAHPGGRHRLAGAPPDQPAHSRHLHHGRYFDPVHFADSVRAGADDDPLLRPASGRQRNAQAGGLGAGGGHLPRRRLGASGRRGLDLPRPPGAGDDHLPDLPVHPSGSRLERAGGVFHPPLPGGALPEVISLIWINH